MKIRKLVAAFVATVVAAAGLGAVALPAGANHLAPNVCVFAGTVHLDPGVNLLPPSRSGIYDFDAIIMVCVGAGMPPLGGVSSEGTYHGDGSFAGRVDVWSGTDCDGTVNGTRAGVVILGTVDTLHCGEGPLIGVFLPTRVDLTTGFITDALVVGAVVLLD